MPIIQGKIVLNDIVYNYYRGFFVKYYYTIENNGIQLDILLYFKRWHSCAFFVALRGSMKNA